MSQRTALEYGQKECGKSLQNRGGSAKNPTRRQRSMQKLNWKIRALHYVTPCYCCYCQQLEVIGTTSKTDSAVENVEKPQLQRLFIFNYLITESK
jgi:hypothetical protein